MKPTEVVSDPAVLAGKPVIAGTRISVELILEKLAAGETEAQILDAYPHLANDAVRVALGPCAPTSCIRIGRRSAPARLQLPRRTVTQKSSDRSNVSPGSATSSTVAEPFRVSVRR